MEKKLKNLLERTLVVPYDDEEITRLEKVCEAFAGDEDFNDDTLSDLAIMVLIHTSNDKIKKKLSELYESQNNEMLIIPKSVSEALAAYTIYKNIEDSPSTHQLALLNCMVLMNKQWEQTPFPELFAECIDLSLKGIGEECLLESVEDTDFLTKLFNSKNELLNSTIDNEKIKILKQLARDAWYHRMSEYIKSEELKPYESYAKVYVALNHIVNSMPWDFLNERAIEQIKEIVPNAETKALTIKEISDMVRPLYNTEFDLNCNSSLLMHVIADQEHQAASWPFMETTLTEREFAVYLYYELILEKYFR